MADQAVRIGAKQLFPSSDTTGPLSTADGVSRLELAINGADLGTWDWNVKTGQVVFNELWASMLGYDLSEIKPHVSSWEVLVHPEDIPGVMTVLNDHLAGRTAFYRSEHRVRHKDGTYVWILDHGRVLERDADGNAVRAAGIHKNITQRKQVEHALREERERLGTLLDTIPQLVWTATPDGVHELWNERLVSYSGLTAEQLVDAGWTQLVHEDDIEEAQRWRSCLRNGERYEGECRLRRFDDEYRWHLITAVAMRHDGGEVARWFGSCTDIQHQRQAHEAVHDAAERMRLQSILTSMSDGVVIADANGRITSMNPAALRLHGFQQSTDANLDFAELLQLFEVEHLDRRLMDRNEWPMARAMRGESFNGVRVIVRPKRGGDYWVASCSGSVVRDGRGSISMIVLTVRDVTAQHRLEEEMSKANSALHRLSGQLLRLQDEERRRIARELHDGTVQVLSAVSMNLSLVSQAPAMQSSPVEARLIADTIALTRQCLNELRSLSHLLHPPALDELGLTATLRSWVEGFSTRSGIQIDLDLQETGRLRPEMETALFRIVQEALANVQRHSGSMTAAVRLKADAQNVRLCVEDEGRGVPAHLTGTRAGGPDLGVGVLGMRERARQLGGMLEIQRRAPGTLVQVILPRTLPS